MWQHSGRQTEWDEPDPISEARDQTLVTLRPRRGKTTPQEMPPEPGPRGLPPMFRHPRFDMMVIPRSVAHDTAFALNGKDGAGQWRWVTSDWEPAPELPNVDYGEPGDYNARMVYWISEPDVTENAFLNPRYDLSQSETVFMRHLIYVENVMGQQK